MLLGDTITFIGPCPATWSTKLPGTRRDLFISPGCCACSRCTFRPPSTPPQVDGLANRGDLGDILEKHIDYKSNSFSLVLRARLFAVQKIVPGSIPSPLATEAELHPNSGRRKHGRGMPLGLDSGQHFGRKGMMDASAARSSGPGGSTYEASACLRVEMQLPHGYVILHLLVLGCIKGRPLYSGP